MIKNKNYYSRFLYATIVIALLWYISQHIEKLEKLSHLTISWQWLAMSLVCVTAAYVCMALIWLLLYRRMKLQGSSGKRVLASWFLSQTGKYVPGKVAVLLVRFDICDTDRKSALTMASFIEYTASTAAAMIWILLALIYAPQELFPMFYQYFAIAGLIVLMLFLWPPLLKKISGFLLRVFKREAIQQIPTYPAMLAFTGLYLVPPLFHGLAISAAIAALTPFDARYFFLVTGIYQAAGLIGMAAFFAPGGLAVREGVLLILLPMLFPFAQILAVTVIIRLINVVVEMFLAAVSFLVIKKCKVANE